MLKGNDEEGIYVASQAIPPTKQKLCDCGSPNCSASTCAHPEKIENKQPSDHEVAIPAVPESSKNIVLLKPESVIPVVKKLEELEESEEEYKTPEDAEEESSPVFSNGTSVKDSADLLISQQSKDLHSNLLRNNECLCSLRDSKNHLLRKYIKHFNKTIHYSKHLQKLRKLTTPEIDAKTKGTYVCSKRQTNCCQCLPAKRTTAMARKIDRSPCEFLDKNMKYCNRAAGATNKNKNECVIIVCPSSDEVDAEAIEKQSKYVCTSPNHSLSSDQPKVQGNQDWPPESPATTHTKSSKIPRSDHIGFESYEDYLFVKHGKNNDRIARRKQTPFPSDLLNPQSTSSFQSEEDNEATSQSSSEYEEVSTNGNTMVDKESNCSQVDSKEYKEKKPKSVDNIRTTTGVCGCRSPISRFRAYGDPKANFSKCLNEKSKQLAQKYHSEKKTTPAECSLPKLCIRKQIAEQAKCRTREMHEQAQLIKNSLRSCVNSCCPRTCFENKATDAKRDNYTKEQDSSSLDKFTCTCMGISCSSKQVSCQPLQTDNSTDTYPYDESSLSSCVNMNILNIPTNSNNCYNACNKIEDRDENFCACDKMNFDICSGTFGNQENNYHTRYCCIPIPYSERCDEPTYCMHLNHAFYPTTAIQVNSVELIKNVDTDNSLPSTSPPPPQRASVTAADLSAGPSRDTIRPSKPGQRTETEQILKIVNSPSPTNVSSQLKPTLLNTKRQRETEISNESNESEEVEITPVIIPIDTKVKITSGGAMLKSVSSRGSEAAGTPTRLRESKRVSMKYEFPIYTGDDKSATERASATDSIEERIRILRQNLEQRHELGSESNSNRSEATLQSSVRERGMTIPEEMEINNPINQRSNRFNSSGRLQKKGL